MKREYSNLVRKLKKFVVCDSTGCRLPESVAREIDALVKTLPKDCGYQTKAFAPEIQFEPGERAEVSILTTATVDKTNEVVLPQGVDMDAYRKSMVVLWNHDHNKPVATCAWIKQMGDSLRAKTVYPHKPEDVAADYYTDQVWAMTKSGILKAKSIGFLPRTPKREPTPQELQAYPDWAGAGIWDDVLLLEYSCCAVGINNDALVEAVNTKSLDSAILKSLGVNFPKVPKCQCQHKSEDCVSQKLKYLYEQGEDEKYSEKQLQAIAFAHCHAKAVPHKPKAPRKSVNVDKLLAQALEHVNLDPSAIVAKALENYRNRGKA